MFEEESAGRDHDDGTYGAIQFPEKKWARPGDTVELECNSDYGYTSKSQITVELGFTSFFL